MRSASTPTRCCSRCGRLRPTAFCARLKHERRSGRRCRRDRGDRLNAGQVLFDLSGRRASRWPRWLHPLRRAYFASGSPWISTAVGLVALSPHLDWLWQTTRRLSDYARRMRAPISLRRCGMLSFLSGLAAAMVFRRDVDHECRVQIKRLSTGFCGAEPWPEAARYVAIGTVACLSSTSISSAPTCRRYGRCKDCSCSWCPRVRRELPDRAVLTVNMAVLMAGIAIVAVIWRPRSRIYRNSYGYEEGRNFYRQVAEEATRHWHELTDTPLQLSQAPTASRSQPRSTAPIIRITASPRRQAGLSQIHRAMG